MDRLRRYAPDLSIALIVLAVGLLETFARLRGAPSLIELVTGAGAAFTGRTSWYDTATVLTDGPVTVVVPIIVTLGTALTCALARRHAGAALVTLWVTGVVHLLLDHDVMIAQLSIVYVAFALACWGSTPVIWASATSIPIASVAVASDAVARLGFTARETLTSPEMIAALSVAATAMGVVLGVPWLTGLAVRTTRSARASDQARVEAEQEAERADEIAALRADQARLARDVHDVVGHSLTVILAQAESAQFLDLKDEEHVKRTLNNIAATARRSLSDVRSVLASTADATAKRTAGGAAGSTADGTAGGADGTASTEAAARSELDLNELIEGVRNAGNVVGSTVLGTPRPLPPELHSVAYRTLQEMLTNALKHGQRGARIRVEQVWGEELHLTVANPVDPERPASLEPGLGRSGMMRRLESVGGRLQVDLDETDDDVTYIAQAWLPVRATTVR